MLNEAEKRLYEFKEDLGLLSPIQIVRKHIIYWWNFFQTITNSGRYGGYNIRGGLYKSHFFLENYQKICIQACINNLEENNANISNE